MITLAFNIIARNSSKELKELIPQIMTVADEVVVVVDDRTTDDTIDVCRNLGAKAYLYKWTEGFKGARNFAISKTESQYIAWTDTDDKLPDIDKLKRFKESTTNLNTIYTFKVRNMPHEALFSQVRMFPNHPDVRFVYRIHETIDADVTNKGFKIQPFDMIVQHWGYSDSSKLSDKLKRNLPEMEAEIHSGSFCPSIKFTYSMNLRSLGRMEESREWLKANICNEVKNSAFRDVYLYSILNLAKDLVMSKEYTLAEHYLAQGILTLPDFKEYHILKTKIYFDNLDFYNAGYFLDLAIKCPIRDYAIVTDWSSVNKLIQYYSFKLQNTNAQ